MKLEDRTPELKIVHDKYLNVQKTRKSDAKTSKSVTNAPVFVDDEKIILK